MSRRPWRVGDPCLVPWLNICGSNTHPEPGLRKAEVVRIEESKGVSASPLVTVRAHRVGERVVPISWLQSCR